MNPSQSLSRDRALSRALLYTVYPQEALQIYARQANSIYVSQNPSKHKIPQRKPRYFRAPIRDLRPWHIRCFS